MVSAVGAQVAQLALPLLVLAMTHSPAQAGLLAAARGLPYLLLCLPAGALIDRWDARRTMLWCDSGRALALGSIPLAMAFGHLTLAHLYVVSLLEGTLFVFFNQAESVCLIQVVPKTLLTGAAALNEATFSLSLLVGPSLGGFLYGVSAMLPFWGTALSYLVSVVSLWLIRVEKVPKQTVTTNLAAEIGDGLRWLWQHQAIRFLALLTGGLIFFTSGWALLLIVTAQRLHANAFQIGLLMASGGIGGTLGALLSVPLRRRFSVGRIMIAAAWVWGLTWPVYALAPNLWVLAIGNAISFIVVPIYMATQYAYRLTEIPDALQGRVNSVFRLVAFGAAPLSLALTGVLIQDIGPAWTVIVTLLPQLVLAAIATLYRPLREA